MITSKKSTSIIATFCIVVIFTLFLEVMNVNATYYNHAYVLKSYKETYSIADGMFLTPTDETYTNVYYNTYYTYDTITTVLKQTSAYVDYLRTLVYTSF